MSSILVSADLRVGLGYPDIPERGRELREARIDTVRELINVANHRRVDAVVLAGNTLADNRIDQHDLLDLVDALKLSKAPVLILPGATDPFTADSPYRARSELFEAPIRVMGDSHPVRLGDLTIAPYPILSRDPYANALASVTNSQEITGPSLGVTCLRSLESADELEIPGLQLTVCGGLSGYAARPKVVFCGTPEPMDYSGSGGEVALVTWSEAGATPVVEPLQLGKYRWLSREVEASDLAQALGETEGSTTLLRLAVLGEVEAAELPAVRSLLEDSKQKFFHLSYQLALTPVPAESSPLPILQKVSAHLASIAEAGFDIAWPPEDLPAEPEVALEAITRLYRLLEESPHQELA